MVANPRNTSFQESTKPRNSLPVAPAETMLVQFLLPLLMIFPLPSFATNTTTSKGRVTRESHGGSSLFKLDPGYRVDTVPRPSDGPLQIRYCRVNMRYIHITQMMMAMMTMMSNVVFRASWNLRSILGIDENAMTLSLDTTIRFQWKDPMVGSYSTMLGLSGYYFQQILN